MYEDCIRRLGEPLPSRTRPRLCTELADLAHLRASLDAREARVLGAVDDLDDDGAPAATVARSVSACSQREADRRARRARTLRDLPAAARALADGHLTAEHIDALARAVEATSAEAVAASDLVDRACRRPADLAAKDIRDWTRRNQPTPDIESQQRQRHTARRLSLFENREGMIVLHGEFDPVAGAQIKNAIVAETDRLYHDDGGRDGGAGVRTPEQRRADALANLLTGSDPAAAGAETAQAASPRSTRRPARPVRTQLHVVADLTDGDLTQGRLLDGTPLPAATLQRLACGSDLFGHVFTGSGDPLWLGRRVRLTTDGQWRTLIVRDGGCRVCGADPSMCEAHHVVPWRPPARGPTDIDNLVLLCRHHHHAVHDLDYRLVHGSDGAWRLQPP